MKHFLVLICVFILQKCPNKSDYVYQHEVLIDFTASNLGQINSAKDDYNSNLNYPFPVLDEYLLFSSNRNSDNFNFISYIIFFAYDNKKNETYLNYSLENNDTSLLPVKVNTNYDELGPYFRNFGSLTRIYFFYANNESGNFDIKYVQRKENLPNIGDAIFSNPVSINALNSDADDYYPCIYNNNSKIIFCSNRNGKDFDIYQTNFNYDLLDNSLPWTNKIEKVEALSGPSNDKCPYVRDQILVFTSDRPGGFGGFDLYYSTWQNGVWGPPKNFGEKINSEYDEYRPILTNKDFNIPEKIMIFSSNRPGGKGGFDLYGVRVKL